MNSRLKLYEKQKRMLFWIAGFVTLVEITIESETILYEITVDILLLSYQK
jgi:hypothetical protein